MIKEIICVDIGKTIYVVSTDKDEYYYISTKQRKIVKGCLAELTKVGYWLENEDHSDYLLKLLEDILNKPCYKQLPDTFKVPGSFVLV